jgi:hypothetical protein
MFSWLSDNGKLGFEDVTRNALNLGVDGRRLDFLIEMLPEHVDYGRRNIPNITKESMQKARGTGIGYYTFRFHQLFGKGDDVVFCRVDSLRRDLIAFFESIGAATDELREYVFNLNKQNTSEHADVSAYYSADVAELVRIRDRELVERFGFEFDAQMSEEKAKHGLNEADRQCHPVTPLLDGSSEKMDTASPPVVRV